MLEKVPLLLVDDDPKNLVTLKAVLDDPELDLITATSGNDALRQALRRDFALVLLDVQMPDMDGFETAALMRSNPRTKHLPIIFVTAGMKNIQLQFKGYDLGAVDYLIKPFEPHILQGKVKVFRDLYRQRRELENNKTRLEWTINERITQFRDSEERFRLLATHSPAGIYQIDTDHNCLFVNPRWCEISGLSSEQANGRGWLHATHPEDREIVAESWRKAVSEGREWSQDFRYLRPDGRIAWVNGNAVALRDAQGNLSGYLGNILDITLRKRTEDRERTRSAVMEGLTRSIPLPEILGLVTGGVQRVASDMQCSILLVDESGEKLTNGISGAAAGDILIGDSGAACGFTAHNGKAGLTEDVHHHPDCVCGHSSDDAGRPVTCWTEPITSLHGEVLGVLALRRAGPANIHDEGLIRETAQLASLAIERKRTENELHIAASVHQAVGEAITVTDADNRIIAINPAFTRLTGYTSAEAIGQTPNLLSSGRHGPAFYQKMWQALETTGRWQGEIWNRRKNGEIYPEWLSISTVYGEEGRVQRRIAMFSDITDKKRAEEIIWRQANYDPLTELPNRRLFRDRLEQEVVKARRAGLCLAVLFIDLDRFKEVNDTLGHHTGDLLLAEAANRIGQCVRASDTVARLGGDEFTVIMSDLADIDRIGKVAQDMLDALGQPFTLGSEVAYVSASIGITMFPNDADSVESLLRNADQAMYAAKEAGRNRFSYFTGSMQAVAQSRLQLSNDLRSALADGQLQVHLQPIVELASNRIAKAEALLRWKHPQHGMISPAEFIPIAEENGLINEIGDWVFRESARVAKTWLDEAAPDASLFQISVNKSPRQFFSGKTHETWVAHLQEIGLPAACIAIEITEGLLLEDRPEIAEKLACFRDAGFKVSLDDFGTGYSAMAYLKKFPIDYLKVDQSFVRDMATDPSDQAIVEAIIVMAHKLGLKVIAEGIETEEQRKLLLAAGCDYGQGYLFSRPVPAAEMRRTWP